MIDVPDIGVMTVYISGVHIDNGYEEVNVDCHNSDDVIVSFGYFVWQAL